MKVGVIFISIPFIEGKLIIFFVAWRRKIVEHILSWQGEIVSPLITFIHTIITPALVILLFKIMETSNIIIIVVDNALGVFKNVF